MSLVKVVDVPRRPVSLLEPIIGGQRYLHLIETADRVRRRLAGRCATRSSSWQTGCAPGSTGPSGPGSRRGAAGHRRGGARPCLESAAGR